MILNNIDSLINICEEESTSRKWAKRALMGAGVASLGVLAANSGILGKNIQNFTYKAPKVLEAGKFGWHAGQNSYDISQNGGGNYLDRIGAGMKGASQSMKLTNAGYNAAFKIRDNINPHLFK